MIDPRLPPDNGGPWARSSPRPQGSARLLIVADRRDLASRCRQQFPDLRVVQAPSFMAGIAEVSLGPVRGVVAAGDRPAESLGAAVRGLREAVGPEVPLVLCCEPAYEPSARAALKLGADDYIIYPPSGGELAELLGLSPAETSPMPSPPAVQPRPLLPLGQLAELFDHLEQPRQELIAAMAQLTQRWLEASAAGITAGELSAKAGGLDGAWVLAESIFLGGQQIGQLRVGASQRSTYQPYHAELLRDLAQTFGRLLASAERLALWRKTALTDELTGLGSAAHLRTALAENLAQAGQRGSLVSLLWLAVDGLDDYRQQQGLDRADEAIRGLAELLTRRTRSYDVRCRVDECQFAMLLADHEPPRAAGSQHPASGIDFLRRLREEVSEGSVGGLGATAGGTLRLYAGLATFPWDGRTADDLVEMSRRALRKAREAQARGLALTGPRAGEMGVLSRRPSQTGHRSYG